MPHLVLVDGDDSFRELLGLNLIDEGYQITSFASGRDALAYLEGRGVGDVVLLDWQMPVISGLKVLRRLWRAGITTPVIFLTVLSDDVHEEAALAGGAVDFIVKSRRLSILLRRLELIAKGIRPTIYPDPWRTTLMRLGPLELRFDTNRALWAGRVIDLTLTEFKIVTLLAERAGQDVGYREIYDLVHGSNSPAAAVRVIVPTYDTSSSVFARSSATAILGLTRSRTTTASDTAGPRAISISSSVGSPHDRTPLDDGRRATAGPGKSRAVLADRSDDGLCFLRATLPGGRSRRSPRPSAEGFHKLLFTFRSNVRHRGHSSELSCCKSALAQFINLLARIRKV